MNDDPVNDVPPDAPPTIPPPAPLRLPLYRPRWTWILLAVIIGVYLLEEISGGSQNPLVLIRFGANAAPLVAAGEYWRLFTANFVHIGFMHAAFNAYGLYILGQETEALYGSPRFIAIFLLTGISGAIASFAFTHQLSAGASTAIFGLIGTEVAFFVRNRKIFGALGSSRLSNLLFIGVINLVYGLSNSNIDNFGHLGGLIGGLLLGWLLCPHYQISTDRDGSRHVLDLNSLRAEWIGVLLFCALLVAAFFGALSLHRV